MNPRCAAYARYSTDKQRIDSIEDQVRKCREYAKRKGFQLLSEHIYTDEAVSGATDDRPGLRRLLDAALSTPRPFDVILTDDTSRLSRKFSNSLHIFERLQFAGVRVVFVSQGIDTKDEQAEVLMGVHGLVDSLYIRELRAKVVRGMEGRALDGLHTGGRCFGYKNQPVEHPTRRDSYGRPAITGVRLVVDENEAATVRRIFQLYVEGYSYKRIARLFNYEGVPSPRPQAGRLSRSWCHSSIRKILTNSRYRGQVVWGSTRKLRSPESGKRIYRRTERTEWTFVTVPEQRIISDELWRAVERRREQVKHVYGTSKAGLLRGRAAASPHLFSGLIKCALCGANFAIVSGRGKRRDYSTYGCPFNSCRGESVCRNRVRIRADVLETTFLGKLQTEVLRREVVEYTLARFEEEMVKALDSMGEELQRLREREKVLRREIANLTRVLADGHYSPAVMAEIGTREHELEQIVNRALNSEPNSIRAKLKDLRESVLSDLADVRSLLLEADPIKAKPEIARHMDPVRVYSDGRIEGGWKLVGESGCAGGRNRTAYAGLFRAALYQ